MILYPSIKAYCKKLTENFDTISEERKAKLLTLSAYIGSKYQEDKTPELIVICTHNSRRSHLGQLWLAVGAEYFNLPDLRSYSGGTEATAFHPNAVHAVQRVGFRIETDQPEKDNPVYNISWNESMEPYQAFSTRFDEAPNPTKEFGAIMVCTEADDACPIVPGTDFRLALPFDDPKAFDGTDLQDAKYDERCKQIGTEFLFVMSKVELK
jgi:hypothetical protein